MRWHYTGLVDYLEASARRLGLSKFHADQARSNAEARRASILATQVHERYRRAAKAEDGTADVPARERREIAGTLEQALLEADKLHALAAAAQAMVDEAWRAFGLEPPERPFRVVSDFDTPPPELTPINLRRDSRGLSHPEQRHAGLEGE